MWPFGHRSRGDAGEKLARDLLRRTGHKILSRNYRCPSGEADIVALAPAARGEGKTIVFVEVKTRSSDRYVNPESAVDSRKRGQIVGVAKYYLAGHPEAAEYSVRFDVISVLLVDGQEPVVNHIPDAFEP